MSATPLIRRPQSDGGTFYTFSSAENDLTKALNEDKYKFLFSKFVCLNIPDIVMDIEETDERNYLQLLTTDGSIINLGNTLDNTGEPNELLAQSFQNYALNMESLILAHDYDLSTPKTVAERVFFKWLKETGAIRFNQSPDPNFFVEEADNLATDPSKTYNRVVQYIGDIDIVNNVDYNGDAYTELYFNIPTTAGATPKVLFKSIEDSNYGPDMYISNPSSEKIFGRNELSTHPDGLSLIAYYDLDESLEDENDEWWNALGWTDNDNLNSYCTDTSEHYHTCDNLKITKEYADYELTEDLRYGKITYNRSFLDGISIDFNIEDYRQVYKHTSNELEDYIENLSGYANSSRSRDYEFNAILVYYDLIDVGDVEDINDDRVVATNLFGILFLDNVTQDGIDASNYIQRYPKYKPNKITNRNGNGYGFKFNLRFDVSRGVNVIDTIIENYDTHTNNTFSMDLFADALANLQVNSSKFNAQAISLSLMSERLARLEASYANLSSYKDLKKQIAELRTMITNAELNYSSNSVLLDLINRNSMHIQQLANGNVPLAVQYNTDVLQSGTGINLVRNPNENKVIISAASNNYSICEIKNGGLDLILKNNPLNTETENECTISLGNNNSMARIYVDGSENYQGINSYSKYFNIKVDTSYNDWNVGKSLRIVFPNSFEQLGFDTGIKIYPDINRYPNQYITIEQPEFLSNDPIIELICIMETGTIYDCFDYDVIK